MASKKNAGTDGPLAGGKTPAWADGLKQLYDDVVDEPLPDAFKDLLAQLDDSDIDGDDA
ncbi:MAG: NepR family anti-sigma factor [Erythrobacter sp.]